MKPNDLGRRLERLRRDKENLPRTDRLGKRTQKLEVDLLPGTRTAPQELKEVRPFFALKASIPQSLPPEARKVMEALFDCFEKARSVQEGIVEELLWGFEQCGIDRRVTGTGLFLLEKHGYLKFQGRDGAFIEFISARTADTWVRYQPKFLEMVYAKD